MAKGEETTSTETTETETAKTEPVKADPPAAEKAKETPVETKTISLADAERMVAKAVKEAEKKAAEAEAKAKLGETERLSNELEDMRAEVRMRDARDAIGEALRAAGAKSPQLLFNAVRDQLEFDDAGKLKDLESLVKDLTADYPEQFGKETPASIDGGAGGKGKANGLTQAELEKMTPQEIAKLPWADVRAAMAASK